MRRAPLWAGEYGWDYKPLIERETRRFLTVCDAQTLAAPPLLTSGASFLTVFALANRAPDAGDVMGVRFRFDVSSPPAFLALAVIQTT